MSIVTPASAIAVCRTPYPPPPASFKRAVIGRACNSVNIVYLVRTLFQNSAKMEIDD